MTTCVQNYAPLLASKLHILLALFKISELLGKCSKSLVEYFPPSSAVYGLLTKFAFRHSPQVKFTWV
jgi:hypothetical protein